MKRDVVAKRAIQAFACGFGLLGLAWAGLGVDFVVTGVRTSDRSLIFFMAPMFLILAGIVIAVAWQALRRFGPNAIRNVVGLAMFLAWCMLAWFPEPSRDGGSHWRGELVDAAIVLGPLYLAFVLYRALSRKLIQMTGTAALSEGADPARYPHGRNSPSGNE